MKYQIARMEVTPGFSVSAEGNTLSELINNATLFHDGFPVDELKEDEAKAAYFKAIEVIKDYIRTDKVLTEVHKLYRCS